MSRPKKNDTKWIFVSETDLQGKEVYGRAYIKPLKVSVENLIAGGDFITAIGKITYKG